MKKNKQEKRLLDKENNEALWDDGVKYTIYWELFLIFINTRSMLFGICSLIMLIYFIFFECKNIFNISSKAVRLELIIKAFISTILFVNIKPIKGDIVEIILFFLNQCLILILIVWSITWNENIYFDDKVISFSMLFTTKNGEYCRIKNIAQKLNIDLAFSKKYTSVNRNILYLDELAHRLDNIDVKVLKKYRLLLSIDSKERDCKIVCVRMNDSLNLFL